MKLLLYCTKAKPYLIKVSHNFTAIMTKENANIFDILNGKIVGECDFEVEEICSEKIDVGVGYEPIFYTETTDDISKKSCLTQFEIENYLSCKVGGEVVGYAIHIKNLHIFDEPRELNKCWANTNAWIFSNHRIEKAPQNMQYCGNWNLEKCILISIKPEWLCKILNGEKTIEIRKKVLKEMLN